VHPARDLPARRATEWLDALAETWQKADLVEEKSDVIHAIYERIVVAGRTFVGVRLTPAAYRHGLALALPEAAMARPTGVERVDARKILIPVERARAFGDPGRGAATCAAPLPGPRRSARWTCSQRSSPPGGSGNVGALGSRLPRAVSQIREESGRTLRPGRAQTR